MAEKNPKELTEILDKFFKSLDNLLPDRHKAFVKEFRADMDKYNLTDLEKDKFEIAYHIAILFGDANPLIKFANNSPAIKKLVMDLEKNLKLSATITMKTEGPTVADDESQPSWTPKKR